MYVWLMMIAYIVLRMAGWTLYSFANTKGTIPCGRAACGIQLMSGKPLCNYIEYKNLLQQYTYGFKRPPPLLHPHNSLCMSSALFTCVPSWRSSSKELGKETLPSSLNLTSYRLSLYWKPNLSD